MSANNQFLKQIYVAQPVHDHLHLRLLAVDVVVQTEAWAAEGVRSPFWRLYRNNRAGATLRVGGKPVPLKPGLVYLVPAWVSFSCSMVGEADHFFAHFDPVGWPPAFVRRYFRKVVELKLDEAMERWLDSLVSELQPPSLLTQKPRPRVENPALIANTKGLIYAALARVLQEEAQSSEEVRAWALRGRTPVDAAMAHIETHLGSDLNNEMLATMCHLSKSHFIRAFHRTIGQTPAQYIRERRVARAAEALLLGSTKIEDIAHRMGFPNRFYFSRAFSSIMGASPAAYRRQVI